MSANRPKRKTLSRVIETCSGFPSAGMGALPECDLHERECGYEYARRWENVRLSQIWARRWMRDNWFVGTTGDLKADFTNYGFKLKVPGKKQPDAQTLADIKRYVREVVREYETLDTVVSFWRKQRPVTPYLFKPERCKYADGMGMEVLRAALNLNQDILRQMEPDERTRYSRGEIIVNEEHDEYFRVLTRGNKGNGFGIPRLKRAFRILSQTENMEFGESRLSYLGRGVGRIHSIGWEVRGAGNVQPKMQVEQGSYKKKRANPIESFYENLQGAFDQVRQFDHKTNIEWIDPKWYEGKKWDSVIVRLLWYSGPIGMLLFGKNLLPSLINLLQAQITEIREQLKPYLEYVIAGGFGVEGTVGWSNQCFKDQRVAWDMTKFLTTQGPLSLKSALEDADRELEEERANKKLEAKAPDGEVLPRWDKNHGGEAGKGGGRPAGTKNGDNVT